MFSKNTIQSYLDKKLIRVQKHPKKDLFIYNYTATTQYERQWDEVTLNCRGLILDTNQSIIARPFPKFFNIGEIEGQAIPNEPFDVYEKMDGSLGILYWINELPYIATRGSFTSEQSMEALQMLYVTYKDAIPLLDQSKTYLFEIIYPENRIVVDYGADKKLVLLGIIETNTGIELPLEDIGFPIVKKHDGINDIDALKTLNEDNREGFVIRFKSGLRVKIKMEEYVRLHRLVTQVSSIDIWDHLKNNGTLVELLDRVPYEFYNWVKEQETSLKNAYSMIEADCKSDFKVLKTRKETATYFQTCSYPSVLFNMLDGKDYQWAIWKHLKPDYERPFSSTRQL